MSPFSKYCPLKKHQPLDSGVEGFKVLLGVGVLGLEVGREVSLEGTGVVDVLGAVVCGVVGVVIGVVV
jgi:hypothetical protein